MSVTVCSLVDAKDVLSKICFFYLYEITQRILLKFWRIVDRIIVQELLYDGREVLLQHGKVPPHSYFSYHFLFDITVVPNHFLFYYEFFISIILAKYFTAECVLSFAKCNCGNTRLELRLDLSKPVNLDTSLTKPNIFLISKQYQYDNSPIAKFLSFLPNEIIQQRIYDCFDCLCQISPWRCTCPAFSYTFEVDIISNDLVPSLRQSLMSATFHNKMFSEHEIESSNYVSMVQKLKTSALLIFCNSAIANVTSNQNLKYFTNFVSPYVFVNNIVLGGSEHSFDHVLY
ncbi:hypothetical protein C0J52_01252 [Blattella germanica]|nr:hypothetical protein C0J52_01252 [Blattella germanica]